MWIFNLVVVLNIKLFLEKQNFICQAGVEILHFTTREIRVATIVSMLVQCGCGNYGNTKAFPGRHVENASKPPYTKHICTNK